METSQKVDENVRMKLQPSRAVLCAKHSALGGIVNRYELNRK